MLAYVIKLLLSIHELNLQLTGWLPVHKRVQIEWDLQSTPLEIRTNSVLWSGDMVVVFFYSAEEENAGGVYLRFTFTLKYWLSWCSKLNTWINLPVTPPSATDKVWRITLTRTAGVRLVIHCNDVEVLNTLLSDATCSDSKWSTVWSRDVTKINFRFPSDTASDYYGPEPGD